MILNNLKGQPVIFKLKQGGISEENSSKPKPYQLSLPDNCLCLVCLVCLVIMFGVCVEDRYLTKDTILQSSWWVESCNGYQR